MTETLGQYVMRTATNLADAIDGVVYRVEELLEDAWHQWADGWLSMAQWAVGMGLPVARTGGLPLLWGWPRFTMR